MEVIERELDWLSKLIVSRIKLYFKQGTDVTDVREITAPSLEGMSGGYANFIRENDLNFYDRVYMIMSFVPLLKPQLLDCFNVKNNDTGTRFVEFGCVEEGAGLIPTIETVIFILIGDNVTEKISLLSYFLNHRIFSNKNYYLFDNKSMLQTSKIQPSEELVDMLVLDREFEPHFSESFPARRIVTNRDWSELVLEESTMKMVEEIKLWTVYGEKVREEWGLAEKIKPGFRALFYGPSGSGKTFTASLLGKATGRPVYCIDLSMVVSKYVGETEKNLSRIFEVAEGRNWILFFDEADSMFGKRSNTKDAHDKYANQEVAYLLQRVEGYKGLIILSTNFKSNMDDAFSRRFQSIIRFNLPSAEERERIWRNTFSKETEFEDSIDLKWIADQYQLSGGSILNVVQYCSVMAMSRNTKLIMKEDLIEGIRREFAKEGKVMA